MPLAERLRQRISTWFASSIFYSLISRGQTEEESTPIPTIDLSPGRQIDPLLITEEIGYRLNRLQENQRFHQRGRYRDEQERPVAESASSRSTDRNVDWDFLSVCRTFGITENTANAELLRALDSEEINFLSEIFSINSFFDIDSCGTTITHIFTRILQHPRNIEILDSIVDFHFRVWCQDLLSRPYRRVNNRCQVFFGIDGLIKFLLHPNKNELMTIVSSEELGKYMAYSLRHLEDESALIQGYLDHLDLLRLEKQLWRVNEIRDYEEVHEERDWSSKINLLEQVATILGTHGIRDQELSELLYYHWNPLEDPNSLGVVISQMNMPQMLKLYALTGQASSEESTISELREGFDVKKLFLFCNNDPKIVRDIMFQAMGTRVYSIFRVGSSLETRNAFRAAGRSLKENFGVPLLLGNEVKKDLDYTESIFNPLTRLRTSFGSEIEHEPTKGIGQAPLMFLHRHGFHQGRGGRGATAEYAAGPFLSPVAGKTIFNLFVDTELFHVHQGDLRTLHFSVGLRSVDIYAQWIRMMHMTGLCYVPELSNYYRSDHALYISEEQKSNTYTPYRLEVKDFRFTTVSAYNRFLDLGVPLLTAASAYERALRVFSDEPNSRASEVKYIRLTNSQINSLPLSQEEKRLCIIWRSLVQDFKSASASIGSPKILGYVVPSNQARKIAATVQEVYLQTHDRDDEDRPRTIQTSAEKIHIFDQTYNNILHFAQSRIEAASGEISNVLTSTEKRVLKEISRIAQISDLITRQSEIISFFKRFPWTAPLKDNSIKVTDLHSILAHFDQMVEHAIIFEKIPLENNTSSQIPDEKRIVNEKLKHKGIILRVRA